MLAGSATMAKRAGRAARVERAMRRYWDDRARENAPWYVDTSLAYDDPDMDRFLATGESVVAQALEVVQPASFGTALEIGCGLGRVLLALRQRFDAVVGVDISAEMLDRARDVVGGAGGIDLRHGDGATLAGVGDASVDLVVSFTVFQHIPDASVIDGYLREAGRVLAPGGVLAFQWNNEPRPRAWAARRRVLAALQRTGVRPEARRRHDAAFLGSRVPLARIDRALTDAGLDRVATRGEGTLWAWCWATQPNSRQ
jgi:SAM-dependent methyltransferase